MRILIVTNHFYPEEFKVNSLARELVVRGYRVSVLTGIPDYPKGKWFKGYGLLHKRIEEVDGVKVYRAFIFPRGRAGKIRMMLNYLSITISQIFDAFLIALFHRYDRVLVFETSPVMVAISAVIVRKMQKIPMLFWVTDLWPESLSAAGGVRNPKVLHFFTGLVRWLYRHSDKILISSKGFASSICEKGDFEDKIIWFPQWAEQEDANEVAVDKLPEGFIVMFAGNIGESQDFDHIMEAAGLLKDEKDIHFVILGDGRKLPWVKDYIVTHSLQGTVHTLGRYPTAAMPSFFRKADVLLVALKDEPIFNLTLPSKVQSYMSVGKPIVAMMNGECPCILAEARCGLSVPAGDAAGLAKTILYMKGMDRRNLEIMGENGKRYCEEHFSQKNCIDRLEKMLEEV